MKKLDKQTAYDLFKSKGYKVLDEYNNSSTPILCEKNGYYYKISYSNLKFGKEPSLWGFSNIDNLENNIRNLLKKEQLDCSYIGYNIITKNKKRRILLHLRCSCGKNFDKTLEDFVYNKYKCCHDCFIKYHGENRRKSINVINFIESKGFKVLNKNLNYRKNDYVEVIDSNGFKGYVKYCYLKSNKGMSKFDIRVNKNNYIYNVNNWAKLENIESKCIGFSNKEFSRQGLIFECECGNKFETSISAFQNGKFRCAECSKSISSYEKIFKNYLDSNNIDYIYQYSISQCRDILPLPFDFYLPQLNKIIEIDGEGHFKPTHFNHIGLDKAEKTFEITKKHDSIKDNYCQLNNIPILRISYIDIRNNTFKQIFQKFIED